jgi:hypothetical protein
MARWKPIGDGFILELLSLVGSSLSLMVMIIILACYNNRAIFSWHGVTLNAIISILSTAFKASLILAVTAAISQSKWIIFSRTRHRLEDFDIIDRASRGPLGCIQAIFRRIGG